jgi:hypothetical protein
MVVISVVIHCHPETSGALSSRVEGPPPELEQSSAALTVPSYTRRKGVL